MSAAETTLLNALPPYASLPTFFNNLDSFAEAPEGVAKLRELILDLAVRGKLVEQDENDEPASVLLERSFAEKKALEETGEIKKQPALSPIQDTEVLFDIPSNWSWARAAEISYPISSGTTPAKSVFQSEPEGGIPYLKVYNIRDQEIDFDYKPQYIDQEHHATKMKRSILVPGMVVLNIVGPPLGKTAIIPDTFPAWNCNQAISFFRLIGDILPSYFHLYLRAGAFLRNIELIGTAGQDNISVTKCKHIVVPVPSLSEQRRIVSKVDGLMSLCDELDSRAAERVRLRERASRSCLDRLVSAPRIGERKGASPRSDSAASDATKPAACTALPLTESLSSAWQRLSDHFEVLYACPETLAHLRQSILQLAVQGKLVPQDPNDEPADALLSRIEATRAELVAAKQIPKAKPFAAIDASTIPFNIPDGWRWVRIVQIARRVEYGTSQKASEIGNGVPVLRMNNIQDGRVILDRLKYVPETLDELPALYLQTDDLLFNRTNSYELVGKTGIFKGSSERFTFASYLIRLRPFDGVCPDYVNLAMNAGFYRTTQIEPELTQQCGQANFNGTKMKNSLMPLPPSAEQKRIVAKVDQLLSQCDELSARLRERQSTTQQLLAATIHHVLDVEKESKGTGINR